MNEHVAQLYSSVADEMGDVQYLRQTSDTNLHGLYWKLTKNFVGAPRAHIKDSTFGWSTDLVLEIPMPANEAQAHVLASGGAGAFIVENTSFFGPARGGGFCGNHHCQVAGTGSLCTPEFEFINVDFSRMGSNSPWICFASSGPKLAIFTTADQSLGGPKSVVDAQNSHLTSFPGNLCAATNARRYGNAIECNSPLRRLQVWSKPQDVKLKYPGGAHVTLPYMGQVRSLEFCLSDTFGRRKLRKAPKQLDILRATKIDILTT
jgi:hypothetical protein